MRILVIEDDADLAMGLRINLESDGYDVSCRHTGEDGLQDALATPPQLIILDVMLPGMDGFEVLTRLRAADVQAPVLLLSARAQEVDKVRGFRAGADDYVTKPFGVMELLLRVRALLRRSADPRVAAVSFRVGNAVIDLERRVVVRDGREVALSPKAFELLTALHARRDKVVSRHELLQRVWGYDESVSTRTVDAHVVELRRTLEEDPANPRYLLTARKVGYRLRL